MDRSGIIIMIREAYDKQGATIAQIARDMQMSRNTVRKYLTEDVKPDKRIGTVRGSKLDAYKPTIDELIKLGIYNSTVIFERLQEAGYPGKLSILKAYLKSIRPAVLVSGPAVMRYETKAGQQAQMDWGICHYVDARGRLRKVACFVMILGYSRCRYIEFTSRCDSASLLRCIVHAFEYYGGVPQKILTDRMKTVVIGVENKQPIWQEQFEIFAAELGFIPKLCRVRRPETKGKVERLVDYVKDNFLPGRQFTTILDLNRQASEWLTRVNAKEHATTGEEPIELLKAERLKPLPSSGSHLAYTWEKRTVSKDCFVSYDGVKYGVYWRYAGHCVNVQMRDEIVYIMDSHGEVIQEHDYYVGRKRYRFAVGQYDGLPTAPAVEKGMRHAWQVDPVDVEIRSLSSYELEAGVN